MYMYFLKKHIYAKIGNPSVRLPANATVKNISSVVPLIVKELWCSHFIQSISGVVNLRVKNIPMW